jgi:hypothetical protein
MEIKVTEQRIYLDYLYDVFYSLITVKHNNPYNSKVYSQLIDIRQHVSARIGPSSG